RCGKNQTSSLFAMFTTPQNTKILQCPQNPEQANIPIPRKSSHAAILWDPGSPHTLKLLIELLVSICDQQPHQALKLEIGSSRRPLSKSSAGLCPANLS